jgi:hypothetical protein
MSRITVTPPRADDPDWLKDWEQATRFDNVPVCDESGAWKSVDLYDFT